MQKEELTQLAREIKQSKNKHKILKEIEWFLSGHYTKTRFLTLLITNNLYKPEYDKISDELMNRDLLLELYKLIRKNMNEKS